MTIEEQAVLSARRLLIRDLMGTKCRCGDSKKSGASFCRSCYFSLSRSTQANLYKKIGEGYEAAHEAACRVLDRAVEETSG